MRFLLESQELAHECAHVRRSSSVCLTASEDMQWQSLLFPESARFLNQSIHAALSGDHRGWVAALALGPWALSTWLFVRHCQYEAGGSCSGLGSELGLLNKLCDDSLPAWRWVHFSANHGDTIHVFTSWIFTLRRRRRKLKFSRG